MTKHITAVVTGGATGIGEATVRKLCSLGFSVAIIYKSSEAKAKALVSELSSKGYNIISEKADVKNEKEVNEAVENIKNRLGIPLALVNNAGISEQSLFTDITGDMWDDMIKTNLTGAFNCSKAVLPFMIREKYGRIVNISSMWGQVGASCEVHYSASKAGLIGLTKALAKEVAPSGVTVNCVSPGVIDTNMLSPFTKDEIAALCEDIPMGRLGAPREVAAAVSFLASSDASYITGQNLAVNGGFVV